MTEKITATEITNQITAYLDFCKNIRQMSPNTLRNKQNILHNFARITKIQSLENLTNGIYNQWVKTEISQNTSTNSLNTYVSTILALIKFHQNAGVKIPLDQNQLPRFKTKNHARKFYTRADIAKTLEYADETEQLMIEIMFETGMRIAELANLKVENIKKTKITFIGKGQKNREVYITEETRENLQNYLGKHHIDNGHIWCVVNGAKTLNQAPPTIQTIRNNLQKVFKQAGFDGFYPHALRHSFATDLQRKGASIMEIKEMMGHSNVATTERYLHGFDGHLSELFAKYR